MADPGFQPVSATFTKMTCYPRSIIPLPPTLPTKNPEPEQTCSGGGLSDSRSGSIIDCRGRNLKQDIPIIGTPVSLRYASRDTEGATVLSRTFELKILPYRTPIEKMGNIISIRADLRIGTRLYSQTFPVNSTQSPTFIFKATWDGKNSSGAIVKGPVKSTIKVSYLMERGLSTTAPTTLSKTNVLTFGNTVNKDRYNLGGWTLSNYHSIDLERGIVYSGGGKRETDPNRPISIIYAPNSSNNINVPSFDAKEIYQFSSAGLHIATYDTDTAVQLFSFVHDASGRLTSFRDRDGLVTTIQRDTTGKFTGILGPYNDKTMVSIDANGYISSIKNPAGETLSFSYFTGTQAGLMSSMKNPFGNSKFYTYDNSGLLAKVTDYNGGINQILGEIADSAEYFTNRVKFSTPMSRTHTYDTILTNDGSIEKNTYRPDGSYDTQSISADGKKKRIGFADGESLGFSYEADSMFPERLFLKNFKKHSGEIDFQKNFTLKAQSDPLSIQSWTKVATLNGIGNYSVRFDKSTNIRTSFTPGNIRLIENLNTQGRVIQSAQGNLSPITYAYDANGRLTQVKQSTRSTSLAYNTKGQVASMTDTLGKVTKFTYDLAKRLKTATLANGRVINFSYDLNGNLKSLALPNTQSHAYTFDKKDQTLANIEPIIAGSRYQWSWQYNADDELIKTTFPDTSLVNRSYDTFGRLSTLSAPNVQRTFNYDSMGLLASIQTSPTDWVSYVWSAGWPYLYTWNGVASGTVGFNWLPHDRLGSILINNQPEVTYTYNPDGEVESVNDLTISRSVSNGLITGSAIQGVSTAFSLSALGEVSSYSASLGGSPLVSFSYARDGLGRIASMSKTEGAVTTTQAFTYDAIGQLLTESTNGANTIKYTYDTNGNRATNGGGQTYDTHDRLTADSSWIYTYSRSGYLIKKTHKTNGTVMSFSYDNLGNLLKVNQTGKATIDYAVDGQDRRIVRKVNQAVSGIYLYQDKLRPVAELDSSNALVSVFIYGSKFNSPDLIVKNGVTYRVISDHLGSPLYIVNTTNNDVVQKMTYDTWGRVLTDSNPGFQPFGFAGGIYDSVTGLVRFGARDYDPTIGRWLNKDPIRFDGGWNLYGYVGNDPINSIDPFGTDILVCNTPAAGGMHQKIAIGSESDHKGVAFGPVASDDVGQFFEFDNSPPSANGRGFGGAYPDGGECTKVARRFKTDSNKEDELLKKVLDKLTGMKGPYNPLLNNCRDFANRVFDDLVESIEASRQRKK